MIPVEEILNELQSLTALFTDLHKVSQAKQKPTVPIDCLQKLVYEKLDRIRSHTEQLNLSEKPYEVRKQNARNLTLEEVDALVEQRLNEGWVQGLWGPPSSAFYIHPPVEDPRSQWCAEWIQYKPNHYVPHWIGRERGE